MYPDQDEAGKQALMKLQRFFINQLCFLREESLPKGFKDYSEFYKLQYGG